MVHKRGLTPPVHKKHIVGSGILDEGSSNEPYTIFLREKDLKVMVGNFVEECKSRSQKVNAGKVIR